MRYCGGAKGTAGRCYCTVKPLNALAVPPAAGVRGDAMAGCGCACVRHAVFTTNFGFSDCPALFQRWASIETEAACRLAAPLVGKAQTPFVVTDDSYPKGCSYTKQTGSNVEEVYWNNIVGVGKDAADTGVVCKYALTGAPIPTRGTEGAPSRRRMRASVCSRLHNTEGALQSTQVVLKWYRGCGYSLRMAR